MFRRFLLIPTYLRYQYLPRPSWQTTWPRCVLLVLLGCATFTGASAPSLGQLIIRSGNISNIDTTIVYYILYLLGFVNMTDTYSRS
ncbi:hypothetical protein F5B17DRAFT_389155 [Nemania serpens]|nr:hypothetical protein F5B17DRAFT_389155 [Nemania serpens]